MDIAHRDISVRDLTMNYADNNEEGGVVGYDGKLDIRPPYQREFIYTGRQRDAVLRTVIKGFPLNVLYWATREDDGYELIDGQQRTISICQYVDGDFSIDGRYFYNLQDDEQEQILDYELSIYVCTGNNSEKLDWFQTINIAGEKLTAQELRNAIFHGPFVSDAKRYFSKTGCPAYSMAGVYMSGSPIRQDYLQTVISWRHGGNIDDYMGLHQHDADAAALWDYFVNVIEWTQATFPTYRKDMQGVAWGELYNRFRDDELDPVKLEERIEQLMGDDEVERKKGIYTYVLTGEEKWLNLRQFRNSEKRSAFTRQKGICPVCKEHFEFAGMEADHIKPWHSGGKTIPSNCQMLCIKDNRLKSGH